MRRQRYRQLRRIGEDRNSRGLGWSVRTDVSKVGENDVGKSAAGISYEEPNKLSSPQPMNHFLDTQVNEQHTDWCAVFQPQIGNPSNSPIYNTEIR